MEFYPVPFDEPVTLAEPTIGSLQQSACFRRFQYPQFVFMVVSICGDIKYEFRDPERNITILNLVTGRLFTARGDETIEPLPHAGIIEDVVIQDFKYKKPKRSARR